MVINLVCNKVYYHLSGLVGNNNGNQISLSSCVNCNRTSQISLSNSKMPIFVHLGNHNTYVCGIGNDKSLSEEAYKPTTSFRTESKGRQ